MEEDEVCEEDEEVEELEEIGAEEPHSSLQSGHVCKSESGKEAICSKTQAQFSNINVAEVFICRHVGPQCYLEIHVYLR